MHMSDTKLTDREKRELQGLQAREQLAIKPVMDDLTLFWRDVESRLELPGGAMGTSHRFDPNTLSIVPVDGAKPAEAPTDKPKKNKGGRPRKVKPAESAAESSNGESAPAPEAAIERATA